MYEYLKSKKFKKTYQNVKKNTKNVYEPSFPNPLIWLYTSYWLLTQNHKNNLKPNNGCTLQMTK